MSNNSNQYIQVGGGIIAILFGILQGVDWLFSKYEIDNFYFNVILIILLIGLISSLIIFLAKKNKIKNISLIKSKKKLFFIIIIMILLLFVFVFFFKKINNNDNLVNEKIPELISLFDNGNINEVFLKTKSLLIDYPDNEIIKNYYEKSKKSFSLKTDYDDIEVSIKYGGDSIYNYLGKTPLDSFSAPNSWNSHVLKFKYNDSTYTESYNWLKKHNYFFPSKSIKVPKNHEFFL